MLWPWSLDRREKGFESAVGAKMVVPKVGEKVLNLITENNNMEPTCAQGDDHGVCEGAEQQVAKQKRRIGSNSWVPKGSYFSSRNSGMRKYIPCFWDSEVCSSWVGGFLCQ